MFARFTALILAASFAQRGLTQDDGKAVEKHKTAAIKNLKEAGVSKPSHVETADLLVYSSLPESKTKGVADAAQKTFAFARKTLAFDDKESYWPGKLTVYVLPDWKTYSDLLRPLEQRKPDKGEVSVSNVRIDTPYVAIGADLGEKLTDVGVQSAAGTWVAAVLLNKKAGMSSTTEKLPEWLQQGFGRAAHLRAENHATRMADYRAKAKTVVAGSRTRLPARLADAWASSKDNDYDMLVTSVADFLAFGPDGEKFPAILAALKPNETNMRPTIESAFGAVQWKADVVEVYWQAWVVKGSK